MTAIMQLVDMTTTRNDKCDLFFSLQALSICEMLLPVSDDTQGNMLGNGLRWPAWRCGADESSMGAYGKVYLYCLAKSSTSVRLLEVLWRQDGDFANPAHLTCFVNYTGGGVHLTKFSPGSMRNGAERSLLLPTVQFCSCTHSPEIRKQMHQYITIL